MTKKIELLSIPEFAEVLRVHPNTIRKAIKCGRIQAFRAGSGRTSAYRIYRSELERMSQFDAKEMIDKIIENRIKGIKT